MGKTNRPINNNLLILKNYKNYLIAIFLTSGFTFSDLGI